MGENGDLSFSESLPGALAVVIGSILLAWLCLKFYDEPVRSFLAKHFLKRKNNRSLEPSSSVLQKRRTAKSRPSECEPMFLLSFDSDSRFKRYCPSVQSRP